MLCIACTVIKLYFNVLGPPVIDSSESSSDVLVDIDGITLFSLTINCPIKRYSPTPTVMWLYNRLPTVTKQVDGSVVFYTPNMSPTSTGYDYTLTIDSNNGTYQFVLDNIIGMYQCVVSNEAGQVIINRRVLFKCKLNVLYGMYLMCSSTLFCQNSVFSFWKCYACSVCHIFISCM